MISNFNVTNANKDGCEKKLNIVPDLDEQSAVYDGPIIKQAIIEKDEIQISIEYIGGCGDEKHRLLTNGYFKESFPIQVYVLLSYEKNDSCKRIIKENICFDLKELSNQYKKNYKTNEGTIRIRLQDYKQELYYKF